MRALGSHPSASSSAWLEGGEVSSSKGVSDFGMQSALEAVCARLVPRSVSDFTDSADPQSLHDAAEEGAVFDLVVVPAFIRLGTQDLCTAAWRSVAAHGALVYLGHRGLSDDWTELLRIAGRDVTSETQDRWQEVLAFASERHLITSVDDVSGFLVGDSPAELSSALCEVMFGRGVEAPRWFRSTYASIKTYLGGCRRESGHYAMYLARSLLLMRQRG